MKKTVSPLSLALLLSILAVANSSTTYNATISNYFTNYGYPTFPDYDLGVFQLNETITFNFTCPNVNSNTSSIAFISIPQFSVLYYIDPLNASISYKGALNPDGTQYLLPPFSNATGNNTFYSATYKVSFGNTSITSAKFKLIIYNYYSYSVDANYFYLVIAKNSGIILKITDFTRIYGNRVLRIDQSGNNTFTFSAYPAISNYSGGVSASQLYLIAINPNSTGITQDLKGNRWTYQNFIQLQNQEVLANSTNPNYVNNIVHFNATLTQGYYVILAIPALSQTPNSTAWFTYPSAHYNCPFDPAYPDAYHNFQPCEAVSVPETFYNPGLPCVTFDYGVGICTDCLPGYTLQNGSCMANTTCPPRQYFHFGNCVNVSSLCDGFDAFTGACLNCSNANNFNLVNGICVEIVTACGFRQWSANHTCFNVSDLCKAYDPLNGHCLSCLNPLEQISLDGACVPIKVSCPPGQYAVGLTCATIPTECASFDTTLGKCLSCIRGYFVKDGSCERIVCPPGQVPSNYGIFCVDVSSQCDKYDPFNGDCLSCKDKGYTVREGKCLQLGSPLAGCQERQALGFGPCVGADVNCKTSNLISGICDECMQGFSFDYTGHCAKNAQCGSKQWSVNGQCLGIPENCLKVDSIGFCTQCVSTDYRLELGQCVFFKRCSNQQYLNSRGQCIDVSPNCAVWNPSNGECITCKVSSGGKQVYPTKGVCCPQGQVYSPSSKACVNADALQRSTQNRSGSSCITQHPSLNICLACPLGSSPDYTIPYGCA